jgi:hypothetical protein
MYISLIRIQEAFVHHVHLEHMVARSCHEEVCFKTVKIDTHCLDWGHVHLTH